MGMWSRTLAVPIVVLALLLPDAPASAATSPKQPKPPGKLSTVSGPTQPVTISLAQVSDKATAGTLTLLVKSPAAGTLRLRFIVTKTGEFADTDRAHGSSPQERPVVFEKDGKLTILKGQTRLLRIQFAIAPDAQADLVDGLLIIRLAPSKPAKAAPTPIEITTKGQRGTSPAGGAVSPQPPSPSLIVTSVFPFGHWVLFGERQTVLLPPRVDEISARRYVVYLGSDSAGRLRLTLRTDKDKEGSSGGLTPANLVVDRAGRVGKYTGDVVLGPGTNEKLAMTVHVRDFFLWPFIVLSLGALLGGYGIRRWEQRRRQALLIKRVKEAYDIYEARTRNRPQSDRPPALDPDPSSEKGDLVGAIKKADTDDKYDAQVNAVARYEDKLRRWLRLATAADSLVALEPKIPLEASDAAEDVESVLASLSVKPEDVDQAEGVAERAERMAEILSVFVSVWELWREREASDELNPVRHYRRKAYEGKSESLALRTDLEELRDRLRVLPPRAPEVTARVYTAFAEWRSAELAEILTAAAGRLHVFKPFDQLEPTAIEHRVRMYDWAVGLASLLVTLLAFLLTKYGQEYGTLSDYAQAFTAGFLGQLAGATIAWNLLPPFRSYSATKTTTATQPAKT